MYLGLKNLFSIRLLFVFVFVFLLLPQTSVSAEYRWAEKPNYDVRSTFEGGNVIQESDFTLLWWNIDRFEFAEGLVEGKKIDLLNANLQQLLQSKECPHVLAFGEFLDLSYFSPQSLLLLSQNFPYSEEFQYTQRTPRPWRSRSIKVFSKRPFLNIKTKNLSSFPTKQSEDAISQFKEKWKYDRVEPDVYERTYNRLNIEWNGKIIGLIPLHFSNPWIHNLRVFQSRGSSFPKQYFNYFLDALTLKFSTENPLGFQIESFKDSLKEDMTTETAGQEQIVFGDFNSPTLAHGLISSKVFSLASEHFIRIEPVGAPYTFPSPLVTRFGKTRINIDHFLINTFNESIQAWNLPLGGSSHFPIYLRIPAE